MKEVGRNDPCPCGSGKKYKKCCAQKSPLQRRTFTKVETQARPSVQKLAGVMSKTIRETRTQTSGTLDKRASKNLDNIKEQEQQSKEEEVDSKDVDSKDVDSKS